MTAWDTKRNACATCPDFHPTYPGVRGTCMHPDSPVVKTFSYAFVREGYPIGCPRDPNPPPPPRKRPSKKHKRGRMAKDPRALPVLEPMGKQGGPWE